MRKVEVGDLVVLIAAGLMDMLAQDLAQGLLQQVGGGVVAADGRRFSSTEAVTSSSTWMVPSSSSQVWTNQPFGVFFDLGDLQLGVAADKITVVSDLAAHLCIERGTVQHDQHAVLGLARLVGGDGIDNSSPSDRARTLAFSDRGLVTVKLGGLGGQLTEQVSAPTGNILGQALGAGAFTLLGHLDVECGLIDGKACLGGNLTGQVKREAEGIVQLERLDTGQDLLMGFLQAAHHAGQDVQTGVDGAAEAQLLGADDLLDIRLMLAQLGGNRPRWTR